MSAGYELNAVLDLADESERRLAQLLGAAAYTKGVRAELERLALRSWQRGAKREPSKLPKGVRSRDQEQSQRATPIESPRGVVREVVVPINPKTRRLR